MLQSEAQRKVKMSLSAQGAAEAVCRKMATGAEKSGRDKCHPKEGEAPPEQEGTLVTLVCP